MAAPSPTPYSRNPIQTVPATQPRPTRAQRLLEWSLFAVFGGMIAVALITVAVSRSPIHLAVPNRVAEGIERDRVNVLVMITSAEGRREATEALMLVSVRPSTGESGVLSIPPDLWVRVGRYGSRRIGSALSIGKSSGYPGRGPGLVSDTVADLFGQPVHGYVRLSDAQLAEAIDSIGGIRVRASHGALDLVSGDRFLRGRTELLDGRRAVRFALSREMAQPANDRFAREERQRAVASALFASGRWPLGMTAIQTNLDSAELASLWRNSRVRVPQVISLAPYVDVVHVSTIVDRGEVVRPRVEADLPRIAASAL
jgi:LCP family protein required for cell wall assembly